MTDAQWVLAPEEYNDLPAFKNTTWEAELESRYQAASFIQKLGIRVNLPQTTIATAVVMMHRFYIRETFSKFPFQDLAPAAIFVASKIEEHPRKLKDIIHASLCLRFKTDDISGSFSLSDDSGDYQKLKERLLSMEKILLQTTCFDLTIKHPYNYVFRNVKLVLNPDVEEQLVQSAWIILNDSLRTTLCIRYPPKAVAAASLYYAAKNAQTDLYSNTQASEFELFPEAPKNQVLEVMEEFDSLYKARQKQKTEE